MPLAILDIVGTGGQRFAEPLLTAAQAAQHLAIPRSTIGEWVAAGMLHAVPPRGRFRPTMPLVAVAEAQVLHGLLGWGLHGAEIRRAVRRLRAEFGPFALLAQRLATDGAALLRDLAGPEPGLKPGPEPKPEPGPEPKPKPKPEPGPGPELEPGPTPEPGPGRERASGAGLWPVGHRWERVVDGQAVLPTVVDDHVHLFEWEPDGSPRRLILRSYARHGADVVLDPRYGYGQPVFVRTKVRVVDVVRQYLAGEPPESIAEDYDLAPGEVRAAVSVLAAA